MPAYRSDVVITTYLPLPQKVLTEKRLTARLRMATTRVEEAEQERIWAVATAHSSGLSIRKIAAVTGLSSSRVHQLLHTDEAYQIPEWLNSLAKTDVYVNEQLTDEWPLSLAALRQRLASEGEVLRWCIALQRTVRMYDRKTSNQ